jgi:hypothetical protein
MNVSGLKYQNGLRFASVNIFVVRFSLYLEEQKGEISLTPRLSVPTDFQKNFFDCYLIPFIYLKD